MGTNILGKSVATAAQMANYLLSKNPSPKISMNVEAFCRLYLYLGAVEGVRGDLEFARSCHETGHFSFQGTVIPEQNNYCGHGTVSTTERGSYFPDEATGILVQIQHAKAYATKEPLVYECLDDRYKYVSHGSAPTMEEMGGKWAVPGYETGKYASLEAAKAAKDSYGDKIVNIFNEIIGTAKGEQTQPQAQSKNKPLAGRCICLDAGHYGKYNRSPVVPEYCESDMTWKLHLLQKEFLEELGANVLTTRSNQNSDLALYSRGAAARGCDLFISNHSNAATLNHESVDYVAVYHLVDDRGTTCDDISKEIANKLAPVIAKTMGTKQGYRVLTRQSTQDHNKDGILNDNYYGVLNGARLVEVPGLILEHSFHTNTRSTNWLLDEGNLRKLAYAEAQAIAEYFSQNTGGTAEVEAAFTPYCVGVTNVEEGDVLNIRELPDASSKKTGELQYDDPYVYTIIEERNGWGKLKSGIGWINLKYTYRV